MVTQSHSPNMGRLREDQSSISTATRLGMEMNKLYLLKQSLELKRPTRKLRYKGGQGLNPPDQRNLTQLTETAAILRAIQTKQTLINNLKRDLVNQDQGVNN